ncbi:MAG TPA: methylmalonyl-CoA mutase family protein [Candidatus Dormibacteraeota bacterium]|jgi:methylmalonyl-CoA mutase N-terminal domain/subunit|nr:methylmalonyl-CoA mutase family protein [Candidatus Dormibacteraeota bacterium]
MSSRDPGPDRVLNDSGLALRPVYEAGDGGEPQPAPGTFPYTRGIRPDMYRGRRWTMRQYAGFGTAAESNGRYRFLLEQGQTGLSVAFDLPTQIGYDSDHPIANGEVGKVGVAIDSLRDMEVLLSGLPIERISTSMTINATAAMLLLLYQLVAEGQGCPREAIRGTVQNDILKEYAARGTYIFPPRPSMRLITDIFAYCRQELPSWNTISISGYHMREAGATAPQEIAFTLADAIAYVEAALAAGLAIDDFAPRLSFFFACHQDFFEEVAKFRAARRLWARIMRDRFGARDRRSLAMRFHTQTGGATLTAQQPLNNVVRTSLEALSAVLGGTQSLHANGYDEALALPTEQAAELALRTQQIISDETAVAQVADPLGGSYYVEALTDQVEEAALAIMAEIDERGGAVAAIEAGWIQGQISDSAYRVQRRIESGERVVVGVNRYRESTQAPVEVARAEPRHQTDQMEALTRLRGDRDNDAVATRLKALEDVARGSGNLLWPLKSALAAYATIGECCDVLRGVFGEYQAPDAG